jgi:hypothetical protein
MTNPTHATLVAGPDARAAVHPKTGDKYHCKTCGMSISVTADCHCADANHVRLECCGRPMSKDQESGREPC